MGHQEKLIVIISLISLSACCCLYDSISLLLSSGLALFSYLRPLKTSLCIFIKPGHTDPVPAAPLSSVPPPPAPASCLLGDTLGQKRHPFLITIAGQAITIAVTLALYPLFLSLFQYTCMLEEWRTPRTRVLARCRC